MDTKIIYRYDESGYLEGDCVFQIGEGIELPDNTTEVAPPADADFDANFYRFDGSTWVAEPIPTKIEDFVGRVVPHDTKTNRDTVLREILQSIGRSDEYQIKRGPNLEWIVEKIPQEVFDARAVDAELSAFDAQISSLKDRVATAVLQNDQEAIAALREEYKALMGE